jgi:DNA-binding response OmpR family regulator
MDPEQNVRTDGSRTSPILLVEDDETDVLLLRNAFRNARVANPLIEVNDGHAAIQYLSGAGAYKDRIRYPPPFLMLLDLRLPKLSGFEVLGWIRDQAAMAELIVVVLTGSDYVPDATRARELGANSYLVKPASFKELVDTIKGIIAHWLVRESPPGEPAPMQGSRFA